MLANSDLDHDRLIQRLIDSLPCSECGSTYRWEDVFVVEEEAYSWTLVAFCKDCGIETVVQAMLEPTDILSVDEPPDLAEVAAWRYFLARFDGDLRDLLRH